MRGIAIVASAILLAIAPGASATTVCSPVAPVPPSCVTGLADPATILDDVLAVVMPVIADAHSLASDAAAFVGSSAARAEADAVATAQGALDAALAMPEQAKHLAAEHAALVCERYVGSVPLTSADDEFKAANTPVSGASPAVAHELTAVWRDARDPERLCERRIATEVLGLLP